MKRPLDPISGRAIEVALRIGLWDQLQLRRAADLATLARACDCAPRGLRPLLALLASCGLLRESQGRYRLARHTRAYLEREWPEQWRAFPSIPEYESLEEAVRHGRPVREPVEGEEDQGTFFSTVVPALFDLHWPAAEHLAGCWADPPHQVLDLGAGSAVWSLALASRDPEVQVTAVDRARVLQQVTRPFVERFDCLDRFRFQEGDYHQWDFPDEAFDLVCLGHLLHADGWDRSERLLRRTARALRPGGAIVIAEIVASRPRAHNYRANVFDLSMLMLTKEGVVFDAEELERLLTLTGYGAWEWLQGPGEDPLLVARRESSGPPLLVSERLR